MSDERPDIEKAPDQQAKAGFFAVDRRAWHLVCDLGMNAAVAYLVAARGTGGDNRTTKWSAHAIETRTGISRSRAQAAISTLERAGALYRDPAGKPSHPKYKLVAAHMIPGCEGGPPPALDAEHARVHAALGREGAEVPKSVFSARSDQGYQRWGSFSPRRIAESLVVSGHARSERNTGRFQAIHYDAEAAAKPAWIWLPNALVDGANSEVPPVELIRQTGNALTLRLLVNLYGSQALDEDGGIHFRQIRENYARHKLGEQGSLIVWGFVPGQIAAWPTSPFAAPHLAKVADKEGTAAAWDEFWKCWHQLVHLGLVEIVGHLVHADTAEGEVIYPVARSGTGLEIEQELGRAAFLAGVKLITAGQREWAVNEGVVMAAPVQRHIEGVQMVGVVRLRYRPQTSRTATFLAKASEWQEIISRLAEIAAGQSATSRDDQSGSR